MNHRRLAHLSDLHLGSSPERAEALVNKLLNDDIEHVVVTGDLTHQGAHDEFALFFEVFEPLLRQGRLTFIPGNHDRTGDDTGQHWMRGQRVRTEHRDGLYLVCVDSTGRTIDRISLPMAIFARRFFSKSMMPSLPHQ